MIITFTGLLETTHMQLQFKRLHTMKKIYPQKYVTLLQPFPLPHIFKSKAQQKSMLKVSIGWLIYWHF